MIVSTNDKIFTFGGKTMKKFVSMIVAFVLIIITIFIPANSFSKDNGVSSGKGKGTNAKVESVADTRDVLDSALTLIRRIGSDSTTYSTASNYYYEPKFESLSLTFERDAKTDVYMYGSGITSQDVSVTMKNTTDYRMNNKGEAHIFMDGKINVHSNGSTTIMDFEVEMYISSEMTLMRFTELDLTYDGEKMPEDYKQAMLNKWIDMSYGDADLSELSGEIMQTNYAVLNIFDSYFSTALDSSFDKSGDVYTMTGAAFDALMDDMLEVSQDALGNVPFDIGAEGELKLNLSKATAPEIVLEVDYDYPSSYTSGGSTIYIEENDNYENISYKFYNIDNTVIDFDVDDDDIYTIYDIEELVD